MCTIKFSIELNTFQMDDNDQPTNNICEKSAQLYKIDDISVGYTPGKVLNSHYTPGPNKQCKYHGNLFAKGRKQLHSLYSFPLHFLGMVAIYA